MKKVIPFFKTIGSLNYKNLMNTTFSIDNIRDYFPNIIKISDSVFRINENELKFDDDVYVINNTYILPYPKIINDFVSDMDRVCISLNWGDVINNLKPKDYLDLNGIETYYREQLNKMNKNHELL